MRLLQLIALLALLTAPAHAQNQSMAADRCESLAITGITSFIMDLSSFCANSYTGNGQTWSNLIAAPADSNVQTYYDEFLGAGNTATATDPTFTGLSGHKGDYWSMDGGDYHSHTAGAAPGGFLGNLHCSTVVASTCTSTPSWTMNVVFKYIDNGAVQWIAGTSNATGTAGLVLQVSSGDQVQLRRNDGVVTTNTISTGLTLTGDVTYFLSMTYNPTDGTWKASINGATYSATGTAAFAAITIGPGTMSIGTTNKSTTTPLASGSLLYEFSMMNAIASDANLAAIATVYQARTGLDLTP